MLTFLVVVHVVSAIFGYGVVTAFPFIGMATESTPASAVVLTRLNKTISERVIYPAAILQVITGVALIAKLNIDLKNNAWLGASIVLFIAVLGVATGIMGPLTRRLIAALESTPGSINAEAKQMMAKARMFGIFMTLGLVVIAVLMSWQPGAS